MGDDNQLQTLVPSSQHLDLQSIRCRINELSEFERSFNDVSEVQSTSESEKKLINDFIFEFESKIKPTTLEFLDFTSLALQDLDAYVEHAKKELNLVDAEILKISEENDDLEQSIREDYSEKFATGLEELKHSLYRTELQGIDESHGEYTILTENQGSRMNTHEDYSFEVWDLDNQLQKTKATLSSLQDCDCINKRLEATVQIEDMLSGLKVIEFEGNCIRLSVKTFVPNLEGILYRQTPEYTTESSITNHELLIELMDGTVELKKAEISPNDVFIGEVVEAVKCSRMPFSLPVSKNRSSLEWFIRKVQTRIIFCSLRKLLVEEASKSRYSFEYSDKDETVVAQVPGGIAAFIRIPEGWPTMNSPLKLISLKASDNHSTGISLSFLCKVQKAEFARLC
ncbi:uncharacterized protein LOC113296735 isoform X2 [Papaver somniferum]|uniref:uncharacterized protein LOC113296735 isoform X2 n=1 Tax=Papaver somniferum TaxID=3469 RepID=UPI000E6FBF3B|nr:uncharacterized protein LOC113296735 isoform X2 [Papaver somniferum]